MHRQVQSGVGDLDGVIGDGDAAGVRLGVDHRPRRRGTGEGFGRVEEVVGPELQRNPVVHSIDGVEGRALQEGTELLPGGHQFDVDRLDGTAVDEAQVGVPGGRHEVVLASPAIGHERDHLTRGAGILCVDTTTGLLLERLDPLGLDVAFPGDQGELALTFADRLLRRHRLGGRCDADGRTAGGRPCDSGATGPRPRQYRQCQGQHHQGALSGGARKPPITHDSSISFREPTVPPELALAVPTRKACSGRQATRARRPWASSTSAAAVSRFCRTATSWPPPSSWTR